MFNPGNDKSVHFSPVYFRLVKVRSGLERLGNFRSG
jgi:hypothetical protein